VAKILRVSVEVQDDQGHSYKTWMPIDEFWMKIGNQASVALLQSGTEALPTLKEMEESLTKDIEYAKRKLKDRGLLNESR